MANPVGDEWRISPAEFSHYFSYFHRISPRGEFLAGARARDFLLQSGLPPQALSKIWRLSDMNEDGQLDVAEFCVAMHLIQRVLKGLPVPLLLPTALLACIQLAVHPQLPVADDKHLKKCRSAFSAFHANIGKGVLGGDAAKYLFMKSNLSKGQLFHIWKLSDTDRDGHLTFQEFTVAMHLIYIAKLGYILPVELDATTILPPSFYDIIPEVQAETEQLPETESVRVTLDPFSPPSTPLEKTPSSDGEDPISSKAFAGVSPERYHEEKFEHFLGDPFRTLDPFAENGPHNQNGTDSSSEGSEFDPFVESLPIGSHLSGSGEEFVEGMPPAKPPRAPPTIASEVVMERTEPMLQLAKPVAVEAVDLRELTRLPEGKEGRMPGGGGRKREEEEELSQAEMSAELENLSQASRKFLEESRGRLEEQKERNVPGGATYSSFGLREYRAASMKGLSTAIEEMERGGNTQDQQVIEPTEPEQPVEPVREEVDMGGEVPDDIMAHFDDLEAEILTALDDVNNDREPVETTDQPTTPVAGRNDLVESPEYIRKMERAEWVERPPPPAPKLKPTRAVPPAVPVRQVVREPPPVRRRQSSQEEEDMEDLDTYLEGELASINEMFEQFQTKDQKAEQRIRSETEELRVMEVKAQEDNRLKLPKLTSFDEVTERRTAETRNIEEEWGKEMQRLEEERLQAMREEEEVSEMRTESDEALQTLEAEWKSLLEQEKHRVVDTQREKELRQEREAEEAERRERERRERVENPQEELTVEEWIGWMEEKKKQGMTPAQQAEYERRKQAWIKRDKEREEKRKREEQEKIERTRQRMAQEQKMYKVREHDMRKHRVGEEELKHLHRAQLRREEQEKREREEKARRRKEEDTHREMEGGKSVAKSALAARWEERIRSRTQGARDYRSTVVSGPPVPSNTLEKEELRMLKRMSLGARLNGNSKEEEDIKSQSFH